jgi:acyl-[acyl carrier protein]--UDP-N-acetylglucosamine O-acyltransferase
MTATIHPTALVSSDARIGAGVSVGPFSIIHGNVSIGDGSDIGSHCEIGYPTPLAQGRPLTIGSQATIRSHSVFYEGSGFGDRLTTGHGVTVREGTEAGTNLQIGTLGDIQGTCRIGNYVRLHSNVHIGQHSSIGDFVWLFPYVVLTNDPHPPSEVRQGATLHDYVAVACMSVILPGVTIGRGALVAAHSSVRLDVDPDTVVAGTPAKPICATSKMVLKDGTRRPAYPWRRHFHRGYPDEVVAAWLAEFGNGVPQQP